MDQNTEHIWLLMARKLSGEASSEELSELESLLIKNPGEIYMMEVMQDVWNNKNEQDRQYSENKYKELMLRMHQLGIDSEKFSDGSDFIGHDGRRQKSHPSKKYFIAGGVAAFTLLICFFIFFKANSPEDGKKKSLPAVSAISEINTKYGLKTNMRLPDGTKVYLNSGSKLTYDKDYGLNTREVNLSGEAYFDVIRNTQKPFIIHTAYTKIRVLGTAFNVRCYPDEKSTETSLIRGSLEVSIPGGNETITLKPSEKLIVSNTVTTKETKASVKKEPESKNIVELCRVSLLPTDSSVIETSWVSNRLVFRSETFEQVAHKMEKWYDVEISFNNEKLKSKKLTGIFENETIYQALDALELTTPFSYKLINNKIILSN